MLISKIKNIPLYSLKHLYTMYPTIRPKKCMLKLNGDDIHYTTYLIINIHNGKFYLGKHNFKNRPGVITRYHGSNKYLKRDIKKHGTSHFRMIILKYFQNEKLAYSHENKIITDKMVLSKFCYNHMLGGCSGVDSKSASRINRKRVKDKTHNFLGVRAWDSAKATESSIYTWYISELIYRIYKKYPEYRAWKIKTICKDLIPNTNELVNRDTIFKILTRFETGWIPKRDLVWRNFFTKKYESNRGYQSRNYLRTLDIANIEVLHNFSVKPWETNKHTKNSKLSWYFADKIFRIYKGNPYYTPIKIQSILKRKYNIINSFGFLPSNGSIRNIIKIIKDRKWIPKEDTDWIKFYKKYKIMTLCDISSPIK